VEFKNLLGLGVILAVSVPMPHSIANAQESVTRITLEQALQLFGENNLELQISRAEAAEAAGLARQARAYPNPVAAMDHETLSDGANLSETESFLTVSQQIDWPWRYAQRRTAAGRAADAASAMAQADSLSLAFDVKQAFITSGRAEGMFQVVQQVVSVFRTAEQSSAARFTEGDISGYELRRIRVERARYESQLRHVTVELAHARRRLTALLVPGVTDVLLAPTAPMTESPPAVSGATLLDRALTSRPEIAAAGLSVESASAATSLSRWGALPDPTITAGYKRISGGLDGGIVGLELPIPLLNRQGGDSDAAAARLDAAQRRQLLTRRAVENDVRSALDAYTSLVQIDQLVTDTLLAGSEDLLDIALASYAEGEMTLLDLMDAAEAFREAQDTRTHVTAELWIAYFDLERAAGGYRESAPAGGGDQ
jgi:cobalt-zinc-cadmium efflux system outer membrane protein